MPPGLDEPRGYGIKLQFLRRPRVSGPADVEEHPIADCAADRAMPPAGIRYAVSPKAMALALA